MNMFPQISKCVYTYFNKHSKCGNSIYFYLKISHEKMYSSKRHMCVLVR